MHQNAMVLLKTALTELYLTLPRIADNLSAAAPRAEEHKTFAASNI